MSGSGISWATCKSAHRSRQITTPAPHRSVFSGRMPFLPPNQQRQSTEDQTADHTHTHTNTVAHCTPTPTTCGSCSCRQHIINSATGVSRPPVLDCGTTFDQSKQWVDGSWVGGSHGSVFLDGSYGSWGDALSPTTHLHIYQKHEVNATLHGVDCWLFQHPL